MKATIRWAWRKGYFACSAAAATFAAGAAIGCGWWPAALLPAFYAVLALRSVRLDQEVEAALWRHAEERRRRR